MVDTREFNLGDIIFEEGDDSHEAFRILSGNVEISVNTPQGLRSVAQLREGEIFGEMGLIADKPRTATASALERTTLGVITSENFAESVLRDETELSRYLATLMARLRTTDALLEIAWRREQEASATPPSPTGAAGLELALVPGGVPGQPAGEAAFPDCRVLLTSAYEPGRWRGDTIAVEISEFPFRIGCQFLGPEPPFLRNDLLLKDKMPGYISRDHCAIERNANGYYLRDRGSVGGTIVNGRPLGTRAGVLTAPLALGENVIIFGNSESPHRFFLHVVPVESSDAAPAL